MAKGKKKEALSLEEKLERALVPVEEQPYEVPENWCWTKIGNIANFHQGLQVPVEQQYEDENEERIRFIRIIDYTQGNEPPRYISKKNISSDVIVCEDDIVMVRYGNVGHIGDGISGVIANNMFTIKVDDCIREYVRCFLKNPLTKERLQQKSSSTTMPAVNFKTLNEIDIPLPPLAEQQRIVKQIESLFAKLDEAKEKIQITIEQAEKIKTSVLQEAFNGNLTKVWRKENHYSDNEWESVTLGDVLSPVKDKYDPTCDDKLDIPYIGLEHIEKGKGICSHGSPEEVKSLKTLFKKGDLLYGKLRPYLNKHDVATFDGMCSTDILVYRAEDITTAKYMNYMLGTIDFMEYAVENSSGINLPRTSEKAISAYKMKISNVDEQAEVVRILENILNKQDDVISNCENVLEQVELMKKSILAKAFRGELGTNNPAEENAVELLKSILGQEE